MATVVWQMRAPQTPLLFAVSAIAVLRAVQNGLFGLDDDINSLLRSFRLLDPDGNRPVSTVTPRQLLSMTGGTTVHGFPGYSTTELLPTVPEILGGPPSTTGGAVVQKSKANTEPVHVGWEPGTTYSYSGGGSTSQVTFAVILLAGTLSTNHCSEQPTSAGNAASRMMAESLANG